MESMSLVEENKEMDVNNNNNNKNRNNNNNNNNNNNSNKSNSNDNSNSNSSDKSISNNSDNNNSSNDGNKNMKDNCSNEANDKKEYLDVQDARATSVLKNIRAVMINGAQFEYGLKSSENLDNICMKHNTDTLTDRLNKIVKDTTFLGNWEKARQLAEKHEETKKKEMQRKNRKKIMKIIIQAFLKRKWSTCV